MLHIWCFFSEQPPEVSSDGSWVETFPDIFLYDFCKATSLVLARESL